MEEISRIGVRSQPARNKNAGDATKTPPAHRTDQMAWIGPLLLNIPQGQKIRDGSKTGPADFAFDSILPDRDGNQVVF